MTPERHAQLQEIFEAAVNLSEPRLSAYLDQACGGDQELRNRLNQLLTADEETLFMAEPVPSASDFAVMECPKCWLCYEGPLLACPQDFSVLQIAFEGRRLIDGKYLVERCLGRGGMGAVYLAKHVGLEKRFALKLILRDGAISPSQREGFENEARALGRLSHRNVVAVTDYGVDPRGGGVPYLVMEYLVGRTLRQLLKERKVLPFEEAIDLLRATADAVDQAHSNNIVHGDLKPANLFLSEEPDSERMVPKVVDFGLARLKSPASRSDAGKSGEKTTDGSIRGTPAYMAPELLRSEEASPASDRFAFGALTYEMLTGQPPFGKHLSEIAANIKQQPAAPSLQNRALPADIDAPILALLRPQPQDRPVSASEAVSAVASAWLRAEQRKWRKREWPRRIVLAAVATCAAVLISAGVAQLRLARMLEGRIVDQRFAFAPFTKPDPSLTLVSIDDETLKADERPLTERAGEFADTIDGIFASGARAVAIDLLLPPSWNASQEFAKAVASHADRLTLAIFSAPSGEVIGTDCISRLTAFVLGPEKYASLFGLANLEEDDDRGIRRAQLFFTDQSRRSRQSFAGRAVQIAFPERQNAVFTAPIWIDYSVLPRYLSPISWKDVPARLRATPQLFRDRLVILGATFAGNGDEHRVPPRSQLVSGQFVQALIANTILAGNPISEVPLSRCLAVVGFACLVATAAALCFPQHYHAYLIASVILLCGYMSLAFWIFRSSRTIMGVLGPELAILLSVVAVWGLKSFLRPYPETER